MPAELVVVIRHVALVQAKQRVELIADGLLRLMCAGRKQLCCQCQQLLVFALAEFFRVVAPALKQRIG